LCARKRRVSGRRNGGGSDDGECGDKFFATHFFFFFFFLILLLPPELRRDQSELREIQSSGNGTGSFESLLCTHQLEAGEQHSSSSGSREEGDFLLFFSQGEHLQEASS
jgi:hypothetical protein